MFQGHRNSILLIHLFMSEKNTPLIPKEIEEKEKSKKSCTFDVWPYINRTTRIEWWIVVVLIVLSFYECRIRLVHMATKYSNYRNTISWIEIESIVKFMFSFLKEKKLISVEGEMWRECLFYTYFIFCGFMGLLNCITPVKRALSRKPLMPGFVS